MSGCFDNASELPVLMEANLYIKIVPTFFVVSW